MYEKYSGKTYKYYGPKSIRTKSIRTYIIDFEHKIEQYGRCCCSVYHQILRQHPDVVGY